MKKKTYHIGVYDKASLFIDRSWYYGAAGHRFDVLNMMFDITRGFGVGGLLQEDKRG